MSTYSAPAPDADALLDYEAVRKAVDDAVHASRLRQREVAERVAALPHREGDAPSTSSISGAVNNSGGRVLALQFDILRALTGARLVGPFFRVATEADGEPGA